MSNNFFGNIVTVNSTSLSITVRLQLSTTGLGATGITAATAGLTMSYMQQGAAPVTITPTALATISSVYTSGGFIESSQRGIYRLDVPNGAWASGADWVNIQVFTGSTYEFNERYMLYTDPKTAFADALLNRDFTAVTDSNARSVLMALRALRNHTKVAAGVLTVFKEDGTTAAWTANVTGTPGADPLTEVAP